ncbi:MAG TPA: ABC transporter permease, partial [Niabella sp.]
MINILGLAVGMGCSILILLWVQNEKSYDRFHAHANEIYRIVVKATDDFQAAVNAAGMPAELKARIPVIKNSVRLSHSVSSVFEVGDKKVEEKNGFYADTTFFQVFSFPLIMGDIRSVLSGPGNIVLSESMAKKYFGDVSPIGKTIHLNNESEKLVTGVFADIPENSHLRFDYLMPMTAIVATDNDLVTNTWDNFNFYSYLLLDDHFKA